MAKAAVVPTSPLLGASPLACPPLAASPRTEESGVLSIIARPCPREAGATGKVSWSTAMWAVGAAEQCWGFVFFRPLGRHVGGPGSRAPGNACKLLRLLANPAAQGIRRSRGNSKTPCLGKRCSEFARCPNVELIGWQQHSVAGLAWGWGRGWARKGEPGPLSAKEPQGLLCLWLAGPVTP